MSWLYKILGGVVADIASKLVAWVSDFISTYFKFSKEKKENEDQAAKVQSIADQIKQLIKDGKDVPPELKDKLREESRRLNSGIFDPDDHGV